MDRIAVNRAIGFLKKAGLNSPVDSGWKKYFGNYGAITKRIKVEKERTAAIFRHAISSANADYNVWGIYREGV